MPGGQFSLAKLFGITLRESANDGSDFTNPDADYRRVFLGEDGLLHVKDSAGTVTDPYTSAASVPDGTVIGDILVWDGAAWQILAAGADGDTLVADSGEALGLKWDVPAAGGGVDSGGSFPGSPASNDLFYRTDRDILYFYDGTRWLSVQLFDAGFSMVDAAVNGGMTATGVAGHMIAPWHQNADIWLERCHLLTRPLATNDATHYWELRLYRTSNTNSDTLIAGFLSDTSFDTANNWSTDHSTGISEVHNTAGLLFKIHATKVSTAGNLFVHGALYYRLVG